MSLTVGISVVGYFLLLGLAIWIVEGLSQERGQLRRCL
jgi:hypothetical protein